MFFFEYFEVYNLKTSRIFFEIIVIKFFKKLITKKLDKTLVYQARPLASLNELKRPDGIIHLSIIIDDINFLCTSFWCYTFSFAKRNSTNVLIVRIWLNYQKPSYW